VPEASAEPVVAEPVAIVEPVAAEVVSQDAAYCPDWSILLGSEGGSVDNVISPNCSAFY